MQTFLEMKSHRLKFGEQETKQWKLKADRQADRSWMTGAFEKDTASLKLPLGGLILFLVKTNYV